MRTEPVDVGSRFLYKLKEYLKIVSIILNDINNNSFEWKNKYDTAIEKLIQ